MFFILRLRNEHMDEPTNNNAERLLVNKHENYFSNIPYQTVTWQAQLQKS